jgi:hypothetical protein
MALDTKELREKIEAYFATVTKEQLRKDLIDSGSELYSKVEYRIEEINRLITRAKKEQELLTEELADNQCLTGGGPSIYCAIGGSSNSYTVGRATVYYATPGLSSPYIVTASGYMEPVAALMLPIRRKHSISVANKETNEKLDRVVIANASSI